MAQLEHINIAVADPHKMAAMLDRLFDWKIRWEGASTTGPGHTIHIGTDATYLALYTGNDGPLTPQDGVPYNRLGGLNHIGIVVDDLDAVEAKVKAEGYTPTSHADYEPGKRFYFEDDNGFEIEVVSYA
jgi:catechol 2,3-dioxygenase-like lactoylglutathione lyase family enzyme